MADIPLIPPPPGVTSRLGHPEDIRHSLNLATQIVCLSIVPIVVILRMVISGYIRKRLELADYTCAVGCILFIGFCVNMLVLNAHGGGYHAWDVPQSESTPFRKTAYAITIIYIPMVFSIRSSMLTYMLRLFSPDPRKALAIRISLIVLLLYYVPILFIKIFLCTPISSYWDGALGHRTCMDQDRIYMADSLISIASDLWILILPVSMLWSLQMSRMEKMRVIGLLGAGGIATAFSVRRLVIVIDEAKATDPTLHWTEAMLTANAEAAIGLFCSCLPVVSPYFLDTKKKSTKDRNSIAHNGYYLRSSSPFDNWTQTSTSRRANRDTVSFRPQTDQAYLISVAEGGESPDASSTSNLCQENTPPNGPAIHKDVFMSQSYEFVDRPIGGV
ncbi:hypothetical protein BDV28DRAFT_130396 [Aspergillus coremiiformis]|uniref:Rhodopsin domain-containing protein n=1 Tax=Aspergillus coremiiformis TaxID=138285 RepID=A0A5N6ZAU3_9EURO|nr:hypothetical protein BDV28DRAFT_130396 [Aspergillus coremiiformis]